MIVSSFVWTQHRNVTDRWTDRIPLASTALCIASNADCGCAVEMHRHIYDGAQAQEYSFFPEELQQRVMDIW